MAHMSTNEQSGRNLETVSESVSEVLGPYHEIRSSFHNKGDLK